MQPNDWISIVAATLTIISAIIVGNVALIRLVVRSELSKFEERLRHDLKSQ